MDGANPYYLIRCASLNFRGRGYHSFSSTRIQTVQRGAARNGEIARIKSGGGCRLGVNYVCGGANKFAGKVIVSEFNELEDNRYFDPESQTSFEIDHTTQVGFA